MTISNDLQDTLEERLARRLAPAMTRARLKIQRIITQAKLDDVRLETFPMDAWDGIVSAFQGILEPELKDAYIQAANEFADGINYPIDPVMLDEAATAWAEQHAFDLAQGMNATSRRKLDVILRKFFDTPTTNRELIEQLTAVYGPRRTSTIAITEVTRAAAEGQALIARELRRQGVDMVAIWETRVDDLVCPICGPRHEMEQGTNWVMPPPAHVGCRCGIRYKLREAVA